tara:strand:+ start:1363 stop:1770 length:408 start_codon:yes stop_codon:yes gene_type:complete
LHLVIDGYGADPGYISDEDRILTFLQEYPHAISMTPISSPHVRTFRGKVVNDWGVSGFILIAESHISVHTFPDRGYVNVDIFSCKYFNPEKAKSEVVDMFALDKIASRVLERGLEYISVPEALDGMINERDELAE